MTMVRPRALPGLAALALLSSVGLGRAGGGADLAQPSALGWLAVRGVLVLAGVGALAMIAAQVRVAPVISAGARRIALAGALAFAFPTAMLHALVWPA